MTKEEFLKLFDRNIELCPFSLDMVKQTLDNSELPPDVKDDIVTALIERNSRVYLKHQAFMLANLAFDNGILNTRRLSKILTIDVIHHFFRYLFEMASPEDRNRICKLISSLDESRFSNKAKETILEYANEDIIRWISVIDTPVPLIRALLKYPWLAESKSSVIQSARFPKQDSLYEIFKDEYNDIEFRLADVFKVIDHSLIALITRYICEVRPELVQKLRPLVWRELRKKPLFFMELYVYAQSIDDDIVKNFTNVLYPYPPSYVVENLPDELVRRAIRISKRPSLLSARVLVSDPETYIGVLKRALRLNSLNRGSYAFEVVIDEEAPKEVVKKLTHTQILTFAMSYRTSDCPIKLRLRRDDVHSLIDRLTIVSVAKPGVIECIEQLKSLL